MGAGDSSGAQREWGMMAIYNDVIEYDDANEDDRMAMRQGSHYDYEAQEWRDGHDHAHYSTRDGSAPLMFCGADWLTCYGIIDSGEIVRVRVVEK